ncbi:hypothetical protein GGX14DRAFT_450901 [Mycena pura]|uniref:Uncharacterized protein n=1 Tax=Mycena pura TaxID=153505 RepID=A0AAD6VEC8_9AGAR|nr:hypothetical protein GGX14DRAFT_450901 [Mycena pura]
MSIHGYSEDEESPILHDFVNETIAREQTPSPRTELLSPPLQGDLRSVRDLQRGPSERFLRQREQAYTNISPNQLLSLLIERDYEARKLRKALHRAFDRSEAEASRAAEAERVTQETLNRYRDASLAKIAAERALAKTNEELRLWKFQFEHAQREIHRAQDVVALIESQRDDAERAAAETRTIARQLNEQRLASDALEEGRRLGYKAGFRRAQQELALGRGLNSAETYDFERELDEESATAPEEADRISMFDTLLPRDIHAPSVPPPRSPQGIHASEARPPQRPRENVQSPSIPISAPAMAMPSPMPAPPSRGFETESTYRPPRSPSIQLSIFPVDIPSASAFNQPGPSRQHQRRPSQAPPQRQLSSQGRALPAETIPLRRPSPAPTSRPPDNYIPSVSANGEIPLPPPFLLSQVVPAAEEPRTQSWYNREHEQPAQAQGAQSWYQAPRRSRSNAGSATGRSAAGSETTRSAHGRHARHASLDARVGAQRVAVGEYGPGTDLAAIREDARSARGSQRSLSVHMRRSAESLVPPPPPAKDVRYQNQVIADELRYSNPDLAESWRRDAAAARTDTASSKSRPPRNVRLPAHIVLPPPLSPPEAGPVPLAQRARTISGGTGKSGLSQLPKRVDLSNQPNLRRVKQKRPISPSEIGSPGFGTINMGPPLSSQVPVPLMSAMPQMDRYLSPNYQTQPLPQAANGLPSGFIPQSATVAAEITVPVTFKGKPISAPLAGAADTLSRQRSTSSLSRPGTAEPLPILPVRPLSAMSASNRSHKSGRSGRSRTPGEYEYGAGATQTLEPGPTAAGTLTHRASNTSLRSTGSYGAFDAKTYVDPAYYAADEEAPVPAPRSWRGSQSSLHSGLEYFGPA